MAFTLPTQKEHGPRNTQQFTAASLPTSSNCEAWKFIGGAAWYEALHDTLPMRSGQMRSQKTFGRMRIFLAKSGFGQMRSGQMRSWPIFSCTPEPFIAFCSISVHPFFLFFERHFQKRVILSVVAFWPSKISVSFTLQSVTKTACAHCWRFNGLSWKAEGPKRFRAWEKKGFRSWSVFKG